MIGVDGIPALGDAGNVLRPYTSVKLSLRLPPTLDADRASKFVKMLMERNPPYGAKVSYTSGKSRLAACASAGALASKRPSRPRPRLHSAGAWR